MSTDAGLEYAFANEYRVQVVRLLLAAKEPISVLDIRARTWRLSGSVISKILYGLRDAGLVHRIGDHTNGTFSIAPDMTLLLAALLDIHDTQNGTNP